MARQFRALDSHGDDARPEHTSAQPSWEAAVAYLTARCGLTAGQRAALGFGGFTAYGHDRVAVIDTWLECPACGADGPDLAHETATRRFYVCGCGEQFSEKKED